MCLHGRRYGRGVGVCAVFGRFVLSARSLFVFATLSVMVIRGAVAISCFEFGVGDGGAAWFIAMFTTLCRVRTSHGIDSHSFVGEDALGISGRVLHLHRRAFGGFRTFTAL